MLGKKWKLKATFKGKFDGNETKMRLKGNLAKESALYNLVRMVYEYADGDKKLIFDMLREIEEEVRNEKI